MTPGEQLVQSIRLKESFYDAHERRSYLRMVEVAKRLVDEPAAIQRGKKFLRQFVRDGAGQHRAYREWSALLQRPAEEVARALLSDTERGAELRDSAPVFVVIPETQARLIWSQRS